MLLLRCLVLWSTTAALLLLAQTAGAKEVENPASDLTRNLARGCSYTVTAAWPDPLFAKQQEAYPDSSIGRSANSCGAQHQRMARSWRTQRDESARVPARALSPTRAQFPALYWL